MHLWHTVPLATHCVLLATHCVLLVALAAQFWHTVLAHYFVCRKLAANLQQTCSTVCILVRDYFYPILTKRSRRSDPLNRPTTQYHGSVGERPLTTMGDISAVQYVSFTCLGLGLTSKSSLCMERHARTARLYRTQGSKEEWNSNRLELKCIKICKTLQNVLFFVIYTSQTRKEFVVYLQLRVFIILPS